MIDSLITAKLIVGGIVFPAVMGLAGGVLPALRASRLSPASAMRAALSHASTSASGSSSIE